MFARFLSLSACAPFRSIPRNSRQNNTRTRKKNKRYIDLIATANSRLNLRSWFFFFIAEYIFRVPHNKNVFTLRKIKSNDSTQFRALKSCGEVDVNRLMNYSSVFNVQIFACCKCFIRKVTLNCFETIFDAICHSDGYIRIVRTKKKPTIQLFYRLRIIYCLKMRVCVCRSSWSRDLPV